MNKQVRFIARNSWLWNRCAEHENTRVETRREKKKVRKQNERMKEKGKGRGKKRKRGENTERGIDYCLPPRINYRSYRCHPSWLHPVRVTPRALINNSSTDPRFHLMPAATTTLSSHRRQVKKKIPTSLDSWLVQQRAYLLVNFIQEFALSCLYSVLRFLFSNGLISCQVSNIC